MPIVLIFIFYIYRVKNAVTPYWNISYEEQLKMKEDDIRKFLVKLGKFIEKNNKNLEERVKQNR